MQRRWPALVIFFLAYSLLFGAQAKEMVIVRSGEPRATIVVSDTKSEAGRKVAAAAADLQRYLEKMSGAKLRIVTDDDKPSGARILVGTSRATAGLKVKIPTGVSPGKRDEGFVIVRSGDVLLLAGNDEGPFHGTEYAVYDFLERQGVRWFMPGEYGEYVPEQRDITCDALAIDEKPDFIMRNWWSSGLSTMQEIEDRWKIRNKLDPDSQSLFSPPNDSSVRDVLPASKYLKSDPEAFALQADGSRNPHLPNLSNPRAVELSANTIKDVLRNRPQLNSYGFAPDDGTPRDYSPETLLKNRGFPAVYGRPGVEAEKSATEEWIEFVNNVTGDVRKEFPDAYIATNGYANRNAPPQGIAIDDHVVIMFAAIWSDALHAYNDPKSWMSMREGQMLRRWAEQCPNVWVYNYDEVMLVSALTPVPRTSKLRQDLPLMKQWGVVGFHNEARNAWAEEGITTKCVRAKLGWNTRADVDTLLADFYARWYGGARTAAQSFWEALEAAIRETTLLGHEDRVLPYVYTPALIERLDRLIAEAEKLADSDRSKIHVRADRIILEHLKAYLAMQRAEFDANFANAVHQGMRMLEFRKQLHAIDPFYMPEVEAPSNAGVYWGVAERIAYYQKLADKTSGATGQLVAILPERARFQIDRRDDGRFADWYSPTLNDSSWKLVKTTEPFYTQGYMDREGYIYLGSMWYRMDVDVPDTFRGQPIHLFAPTVETEGWCWVNGKFVGYRPYREAFERPNDMEFDVTSAIQPGKRNTVAIRVNTGTNAAMAASGLLTRVFLYSPRPD